MPTQLIIFFLINDRFMSIGNFIGTQNDRFKDSLEVLTKSYSEIIPFCTIPGCISPMFSNQWFERDVSESQSYFNCWNLSRVSQRFVCLAVGGLIPSRENHRVLVEWICDDSRRSLLRPVCVCVRIFASVFIFLKKPFISCATVMLM